MNQDAKVIQAANELEDLIPVLRDMVNQLRVGDPQPYARVYWFRRDVSRIVARLGAGIPAKLRSE